MVSFPQHILNSQNTHHKRLSLLFPLFLILVLVALVRSAQVYFFLFTGDKAPINALKIFLSNIAYFFYFIPLSIVAYKLTLRFPFPRTPLRSLLLVHGGVVLIAFGIHQTIMLGVNQFLWQPELITSHIFYQYFNNPTIWIELFVYALFIIGLYFIEYRKINYQQELQRTYIESELVNSRLQELKNRLQPSFLLLTFQTLTQYLHNEQYSEANSLISDLSDYLRTTVYSSIHEWTTLNEEINYLQLYMKIMAVLHGYTTTIVDVVPSELRSIKVPKFTLQPLIENILSHVEQDHSVQKLSISAQLTNNTVNVYLQLQMNCTYKILEHDRNVLTYISHRFDKLYGSTAHLEVTFPSETEINYMVQLPQGVYHATYKNEVPL
ncbi:MAG: histidine kinase [Bacteroidetes bacterium]|nr:histidine kinase [Bacteroidota bacterium]